MQHAGLTAFVTLASVTVAPVTAWAPDETTTADWPYYGGDAGGTRYSPLAQIDRANVARLQVAWEYRTGNVSDGSDGRRKSAFETTPIVAHGTMYFTTPFNLLSFGLRSATQPPSNSETDS